MTPEEAISVSCEPTISEIQRVTAEGFGISLGELMSHRRSREPARARQVAMYLARLLTRNSLPMIGRCFDRHHTTVLHGSRLVAYLARRDRDLGERIASLKQQLKDEERWAA